jgi:predicted secreted protein
MRLKKTIFLFLVILVLYSSGLYAGDNAIFVDLGFSQNGRIYMFGQYGVQSQSLKPWAELFIVDVQKNDFVPNGRISYTHDTPIRAGQDGSGVFFRLISRNSALTDRHGINFQNQGQPLYISLENNPPERGETIDFRDFTAGKTYQANLVFSMEGSGQSIRSSFYINLESRENNGQIRNYTIGNPQIKRPQISSYNIKKVIIDSAGGSIIFIIEMKRLHENGHDIRYMVEVLRL